jgi:hypothetical protein
MQTLTIAPRRALEFGIYRDGDNNLDAVQESVVSQAIGIGRHDPRIAFTVEDTTSHRGGALSTDEFEVSGGAISHARSGAAREMSDPKTLAAFVAHTLDDAEACGAEQTWIDLVDHGGGDGGGLQTSDGRVMAMPKIAQAIADGIALHRREHPEDARRNVDGVVANQCLMATMGFADALSHAGVRYLAASPETMIAPGVPTHVAEEIASHQHDAAAMARGVVGDVMHTRYDAGPLGSFAGAAAFDVLDLEPSKVAQAEAAIRRLNDALARQASDPHARAAIREDVSHVDGMARIPNGNALPWRADRPAIAVYERLASDARLGAPIRADAGAAATAVRALVLAHGESAAFGPFGGADYRDAVGPTVHIPTSQQQIDPWAPAVRETDNAFYRAVDGPSLTRAIA